MSGPRIELVDVTATGEQRSFLVQPKAEDDGAPATGAVRAVTVDWVLESAAAPVRARLTGPGLEVLEAGDRIVDVSGLLVRQKGAVGTVMLVSPAQVI